MIAGIAGTFGLILVGICAFIAVKVIAVGEIVAVLQSQNAAIQADVALLKTENQALRADVQELKIQVGSLQFVANQQVRP